MMIEKRAIVAVVRRLEGLSGRPALFDERMTPARVNRRRMRVNKWLGPVGRAVVAQSEYIPPKIATRRFGKGWTA